MSTVQAPLESRARGEDASEDQPHTYVPPADPTVYTHEDHADSHIATERDRSGRPKRKRITPEQLDALLGLFQQTDTPSYEQRERVAVHLGMSNREVQVIIMRISCICPVVYLFSLCFLGLVPESPREGAQRETETAAYGTPGTP